MRHAIKEQQPTWQLVAATAIVAGVLAIASTGARASECPAASKVADGQGQKMGPTMPKDVTDVVRSVTDEVLWHDTAMRLLEERLDLVVEFGANAVLAPLVKRLPGAPRTLHVGDAAGIERLHAMLAHFAPA